MNLHLLSYISNKIYKSQYGYFIFKDDGKKWIFTSLEKEFDTNDLLNIMDILRNLNEHDI
jgi:hypothetical protein